MRAARILFFAPFTLPVRLKLPPALSCLPKGTIVVEGYKAYSPQDARRLVGFYLPKLGIYDLEGVRIGRVTAGRRGCRFVPGKAQVYLVDESGERVVSVALQKLRLALDTADDRIVGILQPVEFHAQSYGVSTTNKIGRKIKALLESEC